MKRAKSGVGIELLAASIRVSVGGKTATFTAARDEAADVLVVDLDSAPCFDPPHAQDEISVELLARITAAIEAACDEADVEVEFE